MKRSLREFGYFVNAFGAARGAALYLRSGGVRQLRVPGVRHPLHLRPGTSDPAVFAQVFAKREYAMDFGDPKVIFDCGANVGYFGVYAKTRYPAARLVCIEPDPDNFYQLQKNMAPYGDVCLENAGLWHRNARLRVYDKHNWGKWAMVVEEDPVAGTVPAVSVGHLLQKHGLGRIDVLKVDIESSERQVFGEGYGEWLPKVKIIVIELHDFLAEGCAQTFFDAVNRTFRRYSFKACGENVVIVNHDLP